MHNRPGVFAGIYTLEEAGIIINRDPSTLRRRILNNDFITDIGQAEVMKFGKTWLITKEGLERVYKIKIKED